MTVKTKEAIRRRKIKRAVKTAVVGAALALICRVLPVEYQTPCEAVIKLCSGSL